MEQQSHDNDTVDELMAAEARLTALEKRFLDLEDRIKGLEIRSSVKKPRRASDEDVFKIPKNASCPNSAPLMICRCAALRAWNGVQPPPPCPVHGPVEMAKADCSGE